LGYETDERSSLGKRGERRRWREERPERSAAVYIFKAASTAAENIGHRKPAQSDNPEVGGSSPPPATIKSPEILRFQDFFLCFEHQKVRRNFLRFSAKQFDPCFDP